MDGVMPKDFSTDFAKSWVPPILEAAIDLHRAMHLYKFNEDPKIEEALEGVSKLQMRRLCIILTEFVDAYNYSVGMEPLEIDDDEEVDENEEMGLTESGEIAIVGLA